MKYKRIWASTLSFILCILTATACNSEKKPETTVPNHSVQNATQNSAATDDSSNNTVEAPVTTDDSTQKEDDLTFPYTFADKETAIEMYLSNHEYFDGFSTYDLQYKLQSKTATIEQLKEFGATQMNEFTDAEKVAIDQTMAEIEQEIKTAGYHLLKIDDIVYIKSTQKEENDSGAYTHGSQIYLGDYVLNSLTSDDPQTKLYGKSILYHEIFHCLTRSNPDFRADMYKLIHFTVQEDDFAIPKSVKDISISNPDVEHHNSYATFEINGKSIDCFTVLIATKPFEKEGDSFFTCMMTALVPIDGSDTYYTPNDATNFWDIFGKNTSYVIDPEECMADNFSYALAYGMNDMNYENPEIIQGIIDYLKK